MNIRCWEEAAGRFNPKLGKLCKCNFPVTLPQRLKNIPDIDMSILDDPQSFLLRKSVAKKSLALIRKAVFCVFLP